MQPTWDTGETDFPVYESKDGGKTWVRVPNASHKGFKRGYCFRDADNKLKFIGAKQGSKGQNFWDSKLYISEDLGVTWTEIVVPDDEKDVHPGDQNIKGHWFQQVEFDPKNRNNIYIPTSRSIYYFDDGAKCYTNEKGEKSYKLKKMDLDVYDDKGNSLGKAKVFPFPSQSLGFMNIDPNNPDKMWFASGKPVLNQKPGTVLYYTENKGENLENSIQSNRGNWYRTSFRRPISVGLVGWFWCKLCRP